MKFDLFRLSVKYLATKRVLARYDSTGPLYTLLLPTSTTPTPHVVPYALATAASSATWHRRLGHPGLDVLSKLLSSSAITCPRGRDDSLCHACQPFDLIRYDIWTSPVSSVSGYKYYWSSSMAAPTTHRFFCCVRSLTPSPPSPTSSHLCPRSLAAPSGASSAIMDASLITAPPAPSSSHGVQLRMSCPYTSLQNGKTEGMIRTTNNVLRSLLFQASLPARYWVESLHAATYLLNLLP
jgi:hypothetical protein